MKPLITTLFAILFFFLFSCCETEDPGPLQDQVREYPIIDFDQLEMGSGFNIRVEESNTFLVRAEGDRRNINDLEVFKSGTSLIIRYDESSDRNHQTFITIQMPSLRKVNFSGGSISVVSGFESDESLDFILSGGSLSQLDAGYRQLNLIVSGGSVMKLHGLGDELKADISGASTLSAFDYPVRLADVIASGASSARLTVSDRLRANASGSSSITYRGNPQVENNSSGGSVVVKD
jgi:hypothetical protein